MVFIHWTLFGYSRVYFTIFIVGITVTISQGGWTHV